MKALRTSHKSINFLIQPSEREAVLEVLYIMPNWLVREELTEEGLSLFFSYGRKE